MKQRELENMIQESAAAGRAGAQPRLFNRELSLLKFNERVLAMAEHPQVPLLERLRYVCIVSANLDEFFEIRISSLKEQQRQAPGAVGPPQTGHEMAPR